MKLHALTIFLFSLLLQPFAIQAKETAYNDVSYYVVAHEDDWQLFMGTNVSHDIRSLEKVVIIHVTAGDLNAQQDPWGYDACTQAQNVPYYVVRERGAEYSLHLMADNYGWAFSPNPQITFPVVNGHPVRRYEYRNTVMYFMRVVDGDLSAMANDHTAPGRTIDNSSKYVNWCDLTRTLANILVTERVNDHTGWLNIPDIDQGFNPNDHGSHYNAGLAALYAVKFVLGENYPTALFVDYDTENRPVNLGPIDIADESGMSASYNIALIYHHIWNEWRTDISNPNITQDIFQVWCARNYYRVQNSDDVFVEYWDCCRECKPAQRSTEGNINGLAELYPNPSTGLMTLDIEQATDENSKVSVFDLEGKLVFESACTQHVPLVIDIRSKPQGTYLVHISTQSGIVTRKAIFVRE